MPRVSTKAVACRRYPGVKVGTAEWLVCCLEQTCPICHVCLSSQFRARGLLPALCLFAEGATILGGDEGQAKTCE